MSRLTNQPSVIINKSDAQDIIANARSSIQEQAYALLNLVDTLDNNFIAVVQVILANTGRLVISGMGKSGHIGKKMTASLASTGTRALFMHPGEAFHGDLGMVAPEDIVLLISNSGESDEILKLIPHLKRFGNRIIGMHGNIESTLGKNADINLIVKVNREVCPHNLAPTTSTIAAMAMGDALTVSLMIERNFQPADFAQYHPGGSLGRRLLNTVKHSMRTGDLPFVTERTLIRDCIFLMTRCRTGISIVAKNKKLSGVLTDGDIRRALIKDNDALEHPIGDYMTRDPVVINENKKIVAAENLMKNNKINTLVVVNNDQEVVGVCDYFGV